MREVIPPLPQYAFMAWCSVKKEQGQLYSYLYLSYGLPVGRFRDVPEKISVFNAFLVSGLPKTYLNIILHLPYGLPVGRFQQVLQHNNSVCNAFLFSPIWYPTTTPHGTTTQKTST
jgi:hypothetical protein